MSADQDLHHAMEVSRRDPAAGTDLAREFLRKHPDQKGAAGGVIAQAGIDHQHEPLLHEAVALLREATDEHPKHNNGWYNLGNALQALSEVDGTKEPDRYLRTVNHRRESRFAFDTAGSIDEPRVISTQALTNLANSLDHSGRWVEAIEVYERALGCDPTNGAAAGNLAILLVARARFQPRLRSQLLGLAAHYGRIERTNRVHTIAYVGERAAKRFDRPPLENWTIRRLLSGRSFPTTSRSRYAIGQGKRRSAANHPLSRHEDIPI